MNGAPAGAGMNGAPAGAGMMQVLWAAGARNWPRWEGPLRAALAGLPVDLVTDAPADSADVLIYAPVPDAPTDFRPFVRARAVLSLWAGVERIVGNPTLTQPLCRMVDPGLTQGMVEYVVGHVMRAHLGMDDLRQDGVWQPRVPPLATERAVTVLGLGELGAAAARALAGLGFRVHGWARRPHSLDGVICHHGPDGLIDALRVAEVLVTLLPATPDTIDLMNADRLALLPRGASVINPGRGVLIDDAALLAALDSGQVGRATLDVFRTEPLPPAHPFWSHPRVLVTPHIAAETRPDSAARVVAENIRRLLAGAPLLYQVDRGAGY